MITKEQIIKDWNIVGDDISLFYYEMGECLGDCSSLGLCGVDEYLEAETPVTGYGISKGSERLFSLKHLYNSEHDTLIPPDSLLLMSCIVNNFGLEEIILANKLTKNYYVTKYEIFDQSKLRDNELLEYTSSYDVYSFLQSLKVSDEKFEDFCEMLAYCINKCNQIKVNWFLILNNFKPIEIDK